jgi:hypothetical protein
MSEIKDLKAKAECAKDTLISIRKESEQKLMDAAAIFASVKEQKLYKAWGDGFTFKDFCEMTGWSRQHVYRIIRIYANETTRENFDRLGVLKSVRIDRASRKLESMDVPEDKAQEITNELVEFAAEKSAVQLKDKIEHVIAQTQPEPEPEPEDNELKRLLEKKSRLVQKRDRLQNELARLQADIAQISQDIDALTE